MDSVKNNLNLREELKEKCFEVTLSWFEVHEGVVSVKAKSHEEAEKLVEEKIQEYIMIAKKNQETVRQYSGEEVLEVSMNKEEDADSAYSHKFGSDIYISTTGLDMGQNIVLEIGKVKYCDYISGDRMQYKFSESIKATEQFDYYNVGSCPCRYRADVLFNSNEYYDLVVKNLLKKSKYFDFAQNIEEALNEDKFILMLERRFSKTNRPSIVKLRAVKIEKEKYPNMYLVKTGIDKKESKKPICKIHVMDNQYIKMYDMDSVEKNILSGSTILGYNNTKFNLFLNNSEGLNLLTNTVLESIGYTFK